MKVKRDDFGSRIKEYERQTTQARLIPLLPIVARLDGKSFSKYTKRMDRPFDAEMSYTMTEVTKYLVEKTHANIGYTQSDEITLCWYNEDPKSQSMFDRKIHKLVGLISR